MAELPRARRGGTTLPGCSTAPGQARRLDEDTLVRRRRVLGDHHRDLLRSANGLAANLRTLGQEHQARELDEWARARRDRQLDGQAHLLRHPEGPER
ncbi:MAG: tetratricopeptide repeat protein [Pseudonocardiaceae bacterium]